MARPVFEIFTGAKRRQGPMRHLVGLEMEGIEELAAALRQAGERAPEMFAGVLYREAERIMAVSKGSEVPVDWGNLRATGHVQLPEIAGSEVSVTLGYGGPAGPGETFPHPEVLEGGRVGYAVIVHEDTMLRHPTGKAKYLEDPMLRAAGDMEARLADELRRELERT